MVIGFRGDLPIVQIGERKIALYGWNGEMYTECFEVLDVGEYADTGDYECMVKEIWDNDKLIEYREV